MRWITLVSLFFVVQCIARPKTSAAHAEGESSRFRLSPLHNSDVTLGEDTVRELFVELGRKADRYDGLLPPLTTALDAIASTEESTVDVAGRLISSTGAQSLLRRDPRGLKDVQLLLRMLHAQQNPPKFKCAQTRLLVVQFAFDSFEGIGSILKLVALGLAQVRARFDP